MLKVMALEVTVLEVMEAALLYFFQGHLVPISVLAEKIR